MVSENILDIPKVEEIFSELAEDKKKYFLIKRSPFYFRISAK